MEECIDKLESSCIKYKYLCSLCQAKKKNTISDGNYSNYKFNNINNQLINLICLLIALISTFFSV